MMTFFGEPSSAIKYSSRTFSCSVNEITKCSAAVAYIKPKLSVIEKYSHVKNQGNLVAKAGLTLLFYHPNAF